MINKGFNTESVTGKLADMTRTEAAEAEGFSAFLAQAREIPGVTMLSQAAEIFTPEAKTRTDLGLGQ